MRHERAGESTAAVLGQRHDVVHECHALERQQGRGRCNCIVDAYDEVPGAVRLKDVEIAVGELWDHVGGCALSEGSFELSPFAAVGNRLLHVDRLRPHHMWIARGEHHHEKMLWRTE